MERLDGSFIRGYTQALFDVQKFIAGRSDMMKYLRLYSQAGIEAILKFLVDNREELRECGDIEDVVVKKEGKKIIVKKKGVV